MSQVPQAALLIEQIQSLNRIFLAHLQASLRADGPSYGLPAPIARSLAGLAAVELEGLAALPRALFRIDLTRADPPARRAPLGEDRRALYLTLLLISAQVSRQQPILARFFLGIDAETQSRLAALPLAAYLEAVEFPGLVTCAFVRRPLLWRAWLQAGEGCRSTELMLLALQPDVHAARMRAGAAPIAGMSAHRSP